MYTRHFSVILLSFSFLVAAGQEKYLTMKDGVKIYVEDVGTGQTLIFIPGWTMTHRFFEKQKANFSKEYRVVTFDPRGQGRSGKKDYSDNYATHAKDLRQIIEILDLEEVVFVGWSSGCLTLFEYIRNYDFDRIQKLVFIDEPPKWIGDVEKEWVYGDFDGYRSSLKELISSPPDPNGIIDWMLADPVDSLTRSWMTREILMTSAEVALSLYTDGIISNYQDEVSQIRAETPTLFMVRSSWLNQARSWLNTYAPSTQVVGISSHAMFWERPDQFNALLQSFLTQK